MGSEQRPCLQPEAVPSPVTLPRPHAGLGSAPGGPQPRVCGTEGLREGAVCRSVPEHSWRQGSLPAALPRWARSQPASLRVSFPHSAALLQPRPAPSPAPAVAWPSTPLPRCAAGRWHGCGCGGSLRATRAAGPGGLSPVLASRDPAGAPRLGAAWGQDRPDRSSRCPSSDPIGTGVLEPRAAPPCRGRGAVAVLLRQLGGDPQPPRALVPPPALAEPGRALPGEVALLQLLPPPSPLPATAPLPKNPTGDNAS